MGNWGKCPFDFELCIFFWSLQSRTNSLWHWTLSGCLPRKNILAHSFVTVYCMNFTNVSLCHPKIIFASFRAPPRTKSWRRQSGNTNLMIIYQWLKILITHSSTPVKWYRYSLSTILIALIVEMWQKWTQNRNIHKTQITTNQAYKRSTNDSLYSFCHDFVSTKYCTQMSYKTLIP